MEPPDMINILKESLGPSSFLTIKGRLICLLEKEIGS